MNARESESRKLEAAQVPAGFEPQAVARISAALTVTPADLFALYVKTKNFHWHISGPHFRDYHLLLDEQSEQIFATTDAIAERVRKIGGTTLHSIGQIARLQRVVDNDNEFVASASLIENWIDEAEHRTWFLYEATR